MLWFLLISFCTPQVIGDANLNKLFQSSGLVSDIIHKAPSDYLKVRYADRPMQLGDTMTVEQVANEPRIWWDAYPNALYTVVMVDPDATSRDNPEMREWRHWMVVNVPGNKVNRGNTVSKYQGSAPPPGSGRHRYAILVYRQKARFDPKKLRLNNKHRAHFHIERFVKSRRYHHNWPCAGSYFEVAAES